MDGNLLTGTIPNLSALTSLVHLGLSSNQLTGTIPTELANLPNLTTYNNDATAVKITKVSHIQTVLIALIVAAIVAMNASLMSIFERSELAFSEMLWRGMDVLS